MEEEKKNVKKLYVIIALLFIVILGLALCLAFKSNDSDKNDAKDVNTNTNNKSKDTNTTETSKQLDISSELVTKLDVMSLGTINTSTANKICLFKNDVSYVKEFSDTCKENMLWLYLTKYKIGEEKDNATYYSSDVVSKTWKEIFGLDAAFPFAGQTVNGLDYASDGSVTIPASGRFEGLNVLNQTITEAIEKDNEIVIYYDIKFVNTDSYTLKEMYYSDYDQTVSVEEDVKLKSKYKRIFKRDSDGNYYFYSVEKIK